jgi:hypothetical protein
MLAGAGRWVLAAADTAVLGPLGAILMLTPTTMGNGEIRTTIDPAGGLPTTWNNNVTFPNAGQLGRILGTTDIHGVKEQIIKDNRDAANGIGARNPDIGVDGSGNVVLKNPQTGQTVNTGVPINSYKPDGG